MIPKAPGAPKASGAPSAPGAPKTPGAPTATEATTKAGRRRLQALLAAAPSDPAPYAQLAVQLQQAADLEGALMAVEAGLSVTPTDSEADADLLFQGAMIAGRSGLFAVAERFYRRILRRRPGAVPVLVNLSRMLLQQDRPAAARSILRPALRRQPQAPALWAASAAGLVAASDREGAITAYRRRLALDPTAPRGWANLGETLRQAGTLTAAAAALETALRLQTDPGPGQAQIRMNHAVTLFWQGRYDAAWQAYGARFDALDPIQQRGSHRRPFPQPGWRGEPLAGRRLLVWGEQGIGDEILFAGLLPDVLQAGARLVVECEPRLRPLFQRSFPAAEIVERRDPPAGRLLQPDIDFQVAAGDLGTWFRRRQADFPPTAACLVPDVERSRALRRRYLGGEEPAGLRLIGLSWRSAAMRKTRGGQKPLELADWGAVLRIPGIRFISVQYGDTRADLAAVAARYGEAPLQDPEIDPLQDLDAQAAQLAALDGLVSVQNATVQLAGAVGVPIRLLLSAEGDWRWPPGERSPWCPEAQLFRQAADGDWQAALTALAQDLADAVRQSGGIGSPPPGSLFDCQ